jgi:hypothetical protein
MHLVAGARSSANHDSPDRSSVPGAQTARPYRRLVDARSHQRCRRRCLWRQRGGGFGALSPICTFRLSAPAYSHQARAQRGDNRSRARCACERSVDGQRASGRRKAVGQGARTPAPGGLGLVHHRLRLLAFPMRACSVHPQAEPETSRFRCAKRFHTCQGLRPRRVERTLAIMPPSMLPSAFMSTSTRRRQRPRCTSWRTPRPDQARV